MGTGAGDPRWAARATSGSTCRLHYLFCDYDGSTGFFTSADHREKDVDFTHRNFRVRGQIEMPMRRVGAEHRPAAPVDRDRRAGHLQVHRSGRDRGARERFDKEFDFR
jgi:hypothetical protein